MIERHKGHFMSKMGPSAGPFFSYFLKKLDKKSNSYFFNWFSWSLLLRFLKSIYENIFLRLGVKFL